MLRGIAAVSVAFFHFTMGMTPSFFKSACSFGWLGVDIFFVISGFVIPYSLAHSGYQLRLDYPRFLLKRVLRLHPAYLASVVLALGLNHVSAALPIFQGAPLSLSVVGLALHAPLLNDILGYAWVQPIYWTLAIEMQFYIIVGLLFPFFVASRLTPLYTITALLSLSLLPLPGIWIVRSLSLFVMGILTFLFLRSRLSSQMYLLTLSLAGGACGHVLGWPAAIVGTLTSLAIAYVRIPFPRYLIALGTLSYSLYLVHLPIGTRLVHLAKRLPMGGIPLEIVITVAALSLSIVAAWAWFRWIEQPSQRWSSAVRFNRNVQLAPDK